MNLHTAEIVDGGVSIAGTPVPLPRETITAALAEDATSIVLGFRPESLDLVTGDDGFPATATVVEELGADAFCYTTLPGHDAAHGAIDVIARVDPRTPPEKGSRLRLRIRQTEVHAFSIVTGERLPT